jgi:hypothetical protein
MCEKILIFIRCAQNYIFKRDVRSINDNLNLNRGASQSNALCRVKIIEQIRHLKSHLFLKILLRTLHVHRIIIVRTRKIKGKLRVSYSSITNASFPSYYTSILISIYDKITLL